MLQARSTKQCQPYLHMRDGVPGARAALIRAPSPLPGPDPPPPPFCCPYPCPYCTLPTVHSLLCTPPPPDLTAHIPRPPRRGENGSKGLPASVRPGPARARARQYGSAAWSVATREPGPVPPSAHRHDASVCATTNPAAARSARQRAARRSAAGGRDVST